MNYEKKDISVEALKIASCIYRLQQRNLQFGAKGITDILRGSKAEKYAKFNLSDTLSTFGIMQDVTERQCRQMIDFLVTEDWIGQGGEFKTLTLNRKSVQLLKERPVITMNVVKEEKPVTLRRDKSLSPDVDAGLYARLKEERSQISKKEGVPAYIIFTDSSLQDMARKVPTTEMAFLSISGVGRVKLEKYGTRFLRVIQTYLKEQGSGGH